MTTPATIALTRPLTHTIAGVGIVRGYTPGAAPVVAARNGGWCWFANPRAVRHVGTHDRTYFTVLKSGGDVVIYQWDHDTDAVTSFTLRAALEYDDHANASILVLPDGRLMLTYSKHTDTTMRQRFSTNPEDISAWSAEVSLDAQVGGELYTYSCPVQLMGIADDPILMFYRQIQGGAWAGLWRTVSYDDGATWGAGAQTWWYHASAASYWQLCRNGDARIDIAITDDHPDDAIPNGLYHAYYESAAWHLSDGTLIGGGLPHAPNEGTQIHPGDPYPAWVWDITIDPDGYPVIAYQETRSEFDHRYRYARWTGSAWIDNEVCEAGGTIYSVETSYAGGLAIDRIDVNTLYASREIDGAWALWRYVTADNGATWEGIKLTDDEIAPNVHARPVCPDNPHLDVRVLWFHGRYTSYTNYNVQMLSYPKVMR